MLGVTVAIAARKVKDLTSLKYSSYQVLIERKRRILTLMSSEIIKGVNLKLFSIRSVS